MAYAWIWGICILINVIGFYVDLKYVSKDKTVNLGELVFSIIFVFVLAPICSIFYICFFFGKYSNTVIFRFNEPKEGEADDK